jgi:phospholipase C
MVYDHTSVLATIEHKWNLPACTYRDANANTVMDCLQTTPALLVPPVLAEPGPALPGGLNCSSILPVAVPSP